MFSALFSERKKNTYSRLQQSISWLLIATILFLQTFSIPVGRTPQASAQGVDRTDLVSLIVDRTLYTGDTQSQILRYAQDIQAYRANTRVAIFTVEPTAHPRDIAALNEKLFYEGDGSEASNLVGTVLIGKVPLPVVHDGAESFLSVYPYVDFREKNFLYDEASGQFVKTTQALNDSAPDVWHSLIEPNTGNDATDRERLAAFFEKDHAFYQKSGRFATGSTQNPPYVFFFDGYHDQLSTKLINWQSYHRYLDHAEDFAYNRYNKHLAEELYVALQRDMQADIGAAGSGLLASMSGSLGLGAMDFSTIPDLQSKAIIDKSVSPFYGILNEKYLSDVLRYVGNTGRYGIDAPHVDVPAVLVAKEDELVGTTIRSANTAVEEMIDGIVKNEVATPIKLFTGVTIAVSTSGGGGGGTSSESGGPTPSAAGNYTLRYDNYFYGRPADTVTQPRQCSITRGSSLMVEANRAYNMNVVQNDATLLQNDLPAGLCFNGSQANTLSFWGGNSPLNYDTSASSMSGGFRYALKPHRYAVFTKPIFDLAGSREIPYASGWTNVPSALSTGTTLSGATIPYRSFGGGLDVPSATDLYATGVTLRASSPLDCLDNVAILQPYTYSYEDSSGESSRTVTHVYPEENNGASLSCITDLHAVRVPTYEALLANSGATATAACTEVAVTLDGSGSGGWGSRCAPSGGGGEGASSDPVTNTSITYSFKSIPSVVMHKSPTDSEITGVAANRVTPSLPVDRDRYTDFLDGSGSYASVVYPNLFRIEIANLDDMTEEYVDGRIKTTLDATSAQVNALVRKAGAATTRIDLYARLKSEPRIWSAIVRSVLWNNLDNATAKYQFFLEHALDEDTPSRNIVADHKTDYEIAAMTSLGDAANMYVKVDPTAKAAATANVSAIQQRLATYRAARTATNLSNIQGTNQFQCGPPEGVPIWQWVPAVFCWLGTLLPPQIEAGSCSDSSLLDLVNALTEAPTGDRDGNGVLDARETIRDGEVRLSSDGSTYGYNTSIPLVATLEKDGRLIAYDSTSKVKFSIERVTLLDSGSQLVYDRSNPALSSGAVLDKYVSFRPIVAPAVNGKATTRFTSRDHDLNIVASASVTGVDRRGRPSYTVTSAPLNLRVRSESLVVNSETRESATGSYVPGSVITAGTPFGIHFSVARHNRGGSTIPFAGSLTYRVYDVANRPVFPDARPVAGGTLEFQDPLLRQAGTYRFEFRDADGLSVSREITVMPAPIASLEVVPSTSVFVKGQPVYVLVRARDAFANIVSGDVTSIEGTVRGVGKFVDRSSRTGAVVRSGARTLDSVEGYATFEIAADTAGTTEMKFRVPRANVETGLVSIRSIDSARLALSVADPDTVVVGGSGHAVTARVLDAAGAVITGYNGVLALDFPQVSGHFEPKYVQVVDGVNREPISFVPASLAGKNIRIDATLPGIADISGNAITVRPDVPMEVGMVFDRTSLEAKPTESAVLTATLYDRYGNVAWNHPSGMAVGFGIEPEYRKYERFSDGTFSASRVFSGGIADVTVRPTALPGTSYVTATVTPGLESNSFTVRDSTGQTLTISGVSSNAEKFETFYLYNKEKLSGTHYNALYSVLAGAAYGDVTHEGYLGGEVVFLPESRSLAVTTLLNSPFASDSVFSFSPGGQFRLGKGDSALGLDASVSFRPEGTTITFYDTLGREHIADALVRLPATTPLVACSAGKGAKLDDCSVPSSGSYVLMTSSGAGARVSSTGGLVTLSVGGAPVLSVSATGAITRSPSVSLVLDPNQSANLLGFTVSLNRDVVGYFALKFSSVGLPRTRPADPENELVLVPASSRFGYEFLHVGNSSNAMKGIRFYPLDEARKLGVSQKKAGPNSAGLEYSTKTAGIGWEGDNTFLLEIAGGASVGEATKAHSSYSLVNIGDPVIRLPERVDAGDTFDHTVGSRLYSGDGDVIERVDRIDFNGDRLDDLIVFMSSGRIRLLANSNGSMKDMGYLAYVADAGKDRKGVGDFAGDGYGDILGTTDKGKLLLLRNVEGKFTRVAPKLVDGSGAVAPLAGAVTQLKVFDMDQDGRDDAVVVDDAGELAILYGQADGTTFTKHILTTEFGLKITGQTVKTDGAIYYDGLRQLPAEYDPQTLRDESSTMLSTAAAAAGTGTDSLPPSVLKGFVDQAIYYVDSSYQPASSTGSERRPTVSDIAAAAGTDDAGNPNTAIAQSILDSMDAIEAVGGVTDFDSVNVQPVPRTYIRSAFSEGADIDVEKTYGDVNGGSLQGGNDVSVVVKIRNTGSVPKTNVQFLDSFEKNVFSPADDDSATIVRPVGDPEKTTLRDMITGPYDLRFDLGTIPANSTVEIRYTLRANTIAYGEILVGKLEAGVAYGEVASRVGNICGDAYDIWRPVAPYPRSYQKGDLALSAPPALPEAVREYVTDANSNGVPDYVENASGTGGALQYANNHIGDVEENGIFESIPTSTANAFTYDAAAGSFSMGGGSSGGIDAMNSRIDDVVRGLGCGFGGGSCLASPLNWAPLAPGSSPTLFGFPIMPQAMQPNWAYPVFAAPTICPAPPFVGIWPPCPIGAGGVMMPPGISQIRLFVTPTLTLGIGAAVCFGPNQPLGMMPPPGVSPLVPGGNCVVAARPLFNCSPDGSDGDVATWSLPDNGYTNANACIVDTTSTQTLTGTARTDMLRHVSSYVRGDSSPSTLSSLASGVEKGNLKSMTQSPLVGIGLGSGQEPNFEIGIDTDALMNFDLGNIVKVKNIRIPAFPDFLMKWANRQLEEIVNKLTTLPTLYIILPDFSLFETSGWFGFTDKLQKAYDKGVGKYDKQETKDAADRRAAAASESSAASDSAGAGNGGGVGGAVRDGIDTVRDGISAVTDTVQGAIEDNRGTINSVGRNISGIKAAYEFLSNLPLIQIEPETIPVRVPLDADEDLEKWLVDAQTTVEQWQREIDTTVASWERLGTEEGIEDAVNVQAGPLMSSLKRNIDTIRDYQQFPKKLLKYLEFKKRYADQILCNIEAIEFLLGGWLADNAKRFRTWVELYVLIKSILQGWQLLVDLFVDLDSECGVCRNERWDLKHFIFKLLSAVIPSPPIIRFPKWPDIILDLHSIRAGLRIGIPEFAITVVPLILPKLPKLDLPNSPTGVINLPAIPELPPLPPLPDLPDIPSLPLIKLPDLPPPPTIPRLFGIIAAVLQILKLIAKIICLMRINPFVPEWRAGDTIAQLTERQGTLPIDFLFLEFPEFSISFIDAIKVATKVNLEFDIDFIVEMARSVMEPIDSFTSNMTNIQGALHFNKIDLQQFVPNAVEVNVGGESTLDIQGYAPAAKKSGSGVAMLPIAKFAHLFAAEFDGLVTAIRREGSTQLSVAELRDTLQQQVIALANDPDDKVKALSNKLSRALALGWGDADEITARLQATQKEKFDLLKEYVDREQTDNDRMISELREVVKGTRRLQDVAAIREKMPRTTTVAAQEPAPKHADIAQKLKGLNDRIAEPLGRILDPSTDPDMRALEEARADVLKSADEAFKQMGSTEPSRANENLAAGVFALANQNNPSQAFALATAGTALSPYAASSWNAATSAQSYSAAATRTAGSSATAESDPNNLASQYRYNYQGIYYRDSAGAQKRLFQYVQAVTGKERIVEFDRDADGDKDVAYVMNNAVYYKSNATHAATARHVTDPVRTRTLESVVTATDADRLALSAPDYFHEDFTTTGRVNGSFSAADADRETRYRLEMFDYIDRFDRIAAGESERSMAPSATRDVVDLVPTLDDRLVDTGSTATGATIYRNYATIRSALGDFTVRGVDYRTLATGEVVTLRAGTHAYAAGSDTTLEYRVDPLSSTDLRTTTARVPAGGNIVFGAAATVTIRAGSLIIATERASAESTISGDALRFMPVIPGMSVDVPAGGRLFLEYFDRARSVFDLPTRYEVYALGDRVGQYSFSLSRPNGFYYARLAAFDDSGYGTWANLTLLAPQTAADTEAPSITVPDSIRVPVYQRRTYSLLDLVTDLSGVASITIDTDVTVDSDGNGNKLDDRDSIDSANPFPIHNGTGTTSMYDLQLGPFTELMTRPVRLYATDAAGNVAYRDLQIQIYTPVPRIDAINGSGVVSGGLNESLLGEPVDVFRVRNGYAVRLNPRVATGMTATGAALPSVLTSTGGLYDYESRTGSGVLVFRNGEAIANVNERTGRIRLEKPGYTVRPLPRSAPGERMRLEIADASGQAVFREGFEFFQGTTIVPVTSFDSATGSAVYVRPLDPSVRYVQNGTSATTLPGGGYLVGSDSRAIVGFDDTSAIVSVDGSSATLGYEIRDDWVVIPISVGGVRVAEVLYRIPLSYALR